MMRFGYCLVLTLIFKFNFGQPLPLDPAIKTGKLPNGFTYYIRKNTEPKNRVQLYLVNKVGSVLEREDQRGLAHFMEHMSFNGTTHFPKNELVHYLQKSGVRFGADLNAYTSFDETVYQLPVPTDDASILQNGLQIMRDWAANATLDQKEITGERGVVLEEKRLGKGAGERMQEKTFPVLLNHSRYAERIPIGVDAVLNNFKRSAILDFYKDWYRPDLQALIVVGDIDPGIMEAKIKILFSDLKNPVNEKPRTKYTVPLTGRNQFIAVTDKEFPYTVLEISVKQKGLQAKTKSDYEDMIKRGLYNHMLAERIAELSQKPDPPFLEASAGMQGLLGGLDAFSVSVVAGPGQLQNGFSAVWRLIGQLKEFGFTQTEFERARLNYLTGMETALKEKDKRSSESLVKEYTRNFLTGEAAPGIEAEYKLTKDFLETANLSQINALSSSYLADSNRDIVIMAAQKDSASLPDETAVNGWINSINQMALTPYTDDFTGESLISEKLVPGKVMAEKSIPKIGATELTLSNGLKVVLKPTDFKNDEIRFHGFSAGGSSLYGDGDFESASSAAEIVESSGLSHFKPTDLGKLLNGKQVSVRPYISERSEGISGASRASDLETALQLVHLYFTEPRRDSSIYHNIIEQSATVIASRYSEPKNVYADTVSAVLGNYNPRRTGPTLEKLKSIDLDKCISIYKERFANAAGFTFIFDGNFDQDSIRPLLEKYLGSLPSSDQREQARDLGIHIPTGKIEASAHKGSEPKATVKLVISGDYHYSPETNMQLTALSEILGFRILDRLREKEGGAYSPGTSVSYNKFPTNRYAYTISFGCAPQNVDKLIRDAEEEIEKLKTKGATALDITKFSTEEQRQYELHLRDNGYWLNYLSGQYQNGDDPAEILNYPALIKEVNPLSVKSAAGLYLNENNFIRLVLLPEPK